MSGARCPWCHLGGGFHDEDMHDLVAMAVVPDVLRREPPTEDQRAVKAEKHRRNQEWLAAHGRAS